MAQQGNSDTWVRARLERAEARIEALETALQRLIVHVNDEKETTRRALREQQAALREHQTSARMYTEYVEGRMTAYVHALVRGPPDGPEAQPVGATETFG